MSYLRKVCHLCYWWILTCHIMISLSKKKLGYNPNRMYPSLPTNPPYGYPSAPAYPGQVPSMFPAAPAHHHGSPQPSWSAQQDSCFPATPASHDPPHCPSIKPQHADFGWIPPSHCIGSHQWVPRSGGEVPPDAVHGGQDRDGGPIFIGRAFHDGDLLPAKVCPTHGCAFVSFAGQEITKMHYEVLCSNHVAWKYARGGECPPEAIRVGTTNSGEPLFVGRTMIEGTMTPGKVHPSHGVLYIPYDGRELSFPEYEILILN